MAYDIKDDIKDDGLSFVYFEQEALSLARELRGLGNKAYIAEKLRHLRELEKYL